MCDLTGSQKLCNNIYARGREPGNEANPSTLPYAQSTRYMYISNRVVPATECATYTVSGLLASHQQVVVKQPGPDAQF